MPIFANPYPKAHAEESSIKTKVQRPTKKTEEQERSKERIQICCKIQFFGRMASTDKDKLGLRSF